MSDDRFCIVCGVSLDLHGTDEPDPIDCGNAARKAELISAFWSIPAGSSGTETTP
jgi:hypothetical protein